MRLHLCSYKRKSTLEYNRLYTEGDVIFNIKDYQIIETLYSGLLLLVGKSIIYSKKIIYSFFHRGDTPLYPPETPLNRFEKKIFLDFMPKKIGNRHYDEKSFEIL